MADKKSPLNLSMELTSQSNAYIPGAQAFAKKTWRKRMAVPEWPKEYGGAGLRRGLEASIAEEISTRVLFGPVFSAV